MADHIKSIIVSGYISTDGKDWRVEDAKKLGADIAALVQLRGLEFVGSIVARPEEGYSTIDLYRHGASQQGSATVGNSPRADTHERGAVPVVAAEGTAPRDKEHRHYHQHTDGLPPGVVKVTHEHWHVHVHGQDITQHLFTHLDFGQGERMSVDPTSHVKDLTETLKPNEWNVTPAAGLVMPEPMVDTEMDRPVIGLSPAEDERLLTEHAKTCKACQECVTCREGVMHTHINWP